MIIFPLFSSIAPVKYHFQMDADAGFNAPIIDVDNITTTSYTPQSVPAGTYYWHVRASDSANPVNTSLYSPWRRFTSVYFGPPISAPIQTIPTHGPLP